jgi:hypothetical protein
MSKEWSPFDDFKVKPTQEQIELFEIHMRYQRSLVDYVQVDYHVRRVGDYPAIMDEFANISKENYKKACDRFVVELGQFLNIQVHPHKTYKYEKMHTITKTFNRAINDAQNMMSNIIEKVSCTDGLTDLPRRLLDDTYKHAIFELMIELQ